MSDHECRLAHRTERVQVGLLFRLIIAPACILSHPTSYHMHMHMISSPRHHVETCSYICSWPIDSNQQSSDSHTGTRDFDFLLRMYYFCHISAIRRQCRMLDSSTCVIFSGATSLYNRVFQALIHVIILSLFAYQFRVFKNHH